MELLFDHTHGKQEHQDIVICRPMAVVDEDEETEVLDTGWLALDHPVGNFKEVWYQSRSTRINMQKYRPRYKRHEWQGKEIGIKVIDASEMVKLLGLPHIYQQYMARKKFSQDYDPFAHYHAGVTSSCCSTPARQTTYWDSPNRSDTDTRRTTTPA